MNAFYDINNLMDDVISDIVNSNSDNTLHLNTLMNKTLNDVVNDMLIKVNGILRDSTIVVVTDTMATTIMNKIQEAMYKSFTDRLADSGAQAVIKEVTRFSFNYWLQHY